MAYRSFSLIPTFSDNLLSDRFSHMDRLFSRLTGEKPISEIPTYNLLQKDKDNYELTVSVPGYSQEEIDISVLNNQLTISGKANIEKNDNEHEISNKKDVTKWLHKGITKNVFSLSFNLDHRLNIKQAYLDKGLLILKFSYDIPETEKPKKIKISSKNENKIIEHTEHVSS